MLNNQRGDWLLVVLLALQPSGAAASPAAANPSATLMALENQWIEALEKADTNTLSKLFAANFIDTDETGHRSTKTGVLDALRSGALKIRKLQVSDMKVYLYGNTAIVIGTSLQDGAYEGHPLAPKIVFTDTFIHYGTEWKAVASQRTQTE